MTTRSAARALALLLLLAAAAAAPPGCGYSDVRDQCPGCIVVERGFRPVPPPAGARTVVVLVHGILGFGWEWDGAVALLAREPATVTRAFRWSPIDSLGRISDDLTTLLQALLDGAPPSVDTLLVVGHSAGGLATARAAARLRVPRRIRVVVVNIGAPYAGMHTTPFEQPPDLVWTSPFLFTIGGSFTRTPAPAPGVTVESWFPPPDSDPVMRHRFGHDPADPAASPPGRRVVLPPGSGHNSIVTSIVAGALDRLRARHR